MAASVLVAYATRSGSTAEIAEEIAQTLRTKGLEAEVRPAKEVKDVSPYRAVVIGSGVWAMRLFPEARKLAERNRKALANKPVAYFAVCMTMKEDTPENRAVARGFLKGLCKVKEPVAQAAFAGMLDIAKVPGLMGRMMGAGKPDAKPREDCRDWEAIRAWAGELATALA